MRWKVTQEVNVLVLIKGTEHYIFIYDDDSRAQLIETFRDQAANPHLALTWFDAVVLTEKALEQGRANAVQLEQEARFDR